MGRPKDKFLWDQVDGAAARWVCKHCHEEFAGSATRIRNHLSGAGNDISGCAVVPSHIRDEALKKNTRKRRPSSSVSLLRNSSSSTAAAPPPQHDPPPSSSNDPDPMTKSAVEEYVRNAFMKMLMVIGVSDAINHPSVREFWKRAHQHGVPLSLLGNDPFVIGQSLFNIKHEVHQYMLMVKESWKTTGCTMITYNLGEKKENSASWGEDMDVIGFYCPKGFIFVKPPPLNKEDYCDDIFQDAMKQHVPSLEFDNSIWSIDHQFPWFNWECGFPFCETSESGSFDQCLAWDRYYAGCYGCLRYIIQKACMDECWQLEWANSLIGQAVRLHKLLLGEEGNALSEWYYTILAKKGEKMQKFVGEEKQFQDVHLSIFLVIMPLADDMQQLNQQKYYLGSYKNREIMEIVRDLKFWIEGRKLALILTLLLRIPDIMDTLVPTSGYVEMALHKVDSVLLEFNKSSSYGITKTKEAFCLWSRLKSKITSCVNRVQGSLNPWHFLQEIFASPRWDPSAELKRYVEKREELPQLMKDLECCRDVFCRLSEEIQLDNFHPVKLWEQYGHCLPVLRKYAIMMLSQPSTCMCNQVKKHIYQLQGADDYILRLNMRMMEEFKILGDDIYNPIDINAWEWIPAGLRTSEPKYAINID